MSKSFRRNFQTVRLSGTKPSKHGGSIVSTGLRDADELLNGGQPLPSILCLQEDRFHNQTLLKYWCAEVGFGESFLSRNVVVRCTLLICSYFLTPIRPSEYTRRLSKIRNWQ